MSVDRRHFLASAGVIGWQFLVGKLAAVELEGTPIGPVRPQPIPLPVPVPPRPVPPPANLPDPADLVRQALERMKRDVKLGLVVVVPSEPAAAQSLGNQLGRLLGGIDDTCFVMKPNEVPNVVPASTGDTAARVFFSQTVVLCLPRAEVKKLHPDMKADSGLLLLDIDGKMTGQLPASTELFGKDFHEKMGDLLGGERLDAQVKAQKEALGAELSAKVEKALSDLDSETYAVRQAATAELEKAGPRITALLANALRKNPPLESRQRIERLVETEFLREPATGPSAKLPIGTQWVARAHRACPGCGRGHVGAVGRKFLTFVMQPQAE